MGHPQQAKLQRAVPTLPQLLAGVPDALADVGGHLTGEEQPHLPWFLGLADAEGIFEERGGGEASRAFRHHHPSSSRPRNGAT